MDILNDIEYSTDMTYDLKMVQNIFNHNLAQLQCIQDEQNYILESMKTVKKTKVSYTGRILRCILCRCL